jgi:hypothetical protein
VQRQEECEEVKAAGLLATGAANVAQKLISTGRASSKEIANAVPVDRLVRLGFVTDPSKPSLVERGRARFAEALSTNRGLKEREAIAVVNDFADVFTPDEVVDAVETDIESLIGSALIPIKGDRSDLGDLSQVGGVPLEGAARVQAGRKFALENAETDRTWASGQGIAQRVANKAAGVSEDAGGVPVKGVFVPQSARSMDFSTAPAETFARMLPNIPITKTSKEAFNRTIRERYPDFVGVDSPDLVDQIRGIIPITGKNGKVASSGDFRKFMLNRAELEPYRNAGFPQYAELASAKEDAVVRDSEIGDVGSLIMDLDTSGRITPNETHFSYDSNILKPVESRPTRLRYQTPFETIFQDSYDRVGREMTNPSEAARAKGAVPRPFTRGERMNAVSDRGAGSPGAYEMFTEEKAQRYLDYVRRGLASGLPLTALAAGAAQADIDPETKAQIEEFALSEQRQNQGMQGVVQRTMQSAPRASIGSITPMPDTMYSRALSSAANLVRDFNQAAGATPVGLLNPLSDSLPQVLENAAYGSSDTPEEIGADVLRVIGLL